MSFKIYSGKITEDIKKGNFLYKGLVIPDIKRNIASIHKKGCIIKDIPYIIGRKKEYKGNIVFYNPVCGNKIRNKVLNNDVKHFQEKITKKVKSKYNKEGNKNFILPFKNIKGRMKRDSFYFSNSFNLFKPKETWLHKEIYNYKGKYLLSSVPLKYAEYWLDLGGSETWESINKNITWHNLEVHSSGILTGTLLRNLKGSNINLGTKHGKKINKILNLNEIKLVYNVSTEKNKKNHKTRYIKNNKENSFPKRKGSILC
jgi:hypothetical protein